MASQGGRGAGRPYRKASEYLSQRPRNTDSARTLASLEKENEELRDRLANAQRRLETMEVEYDGSREYFVAKLEVTNMKLMEKIQALETMQRSYSELQSINYELNQRISKVAQVERECDELRQSAIDSTQMIKKLQDENARLRTDCNLAVSLLRCNPDNFKPASAGVGGPRPGSNGFRVNLEQYHEHVNPYMDESDGDDAGPLSSSFYGASDRGSTKSLDLKYEGSSAQNPDGFQINQKRHAPHGTRQSPMPQDHYKQPTRSYDRSSNQSARTSTGSGGPSSPWQRMDENSSTSSPYQHEPKPKSKTSNDSSPWVLDRGQVKDVEPLEFNESIYRYSPAAIYGANPVMYPKSNPSPKKKVNDRVLRMPTGPAKSQNLVRLPPSNKGSGENNDVYIAENNSAETTRPSPTKQSSSGHSTRKSTPSKAAIETGSSAEKSSLLDQDDEDDVMTIEYGAPKTGRKPRYRRNASGVEGRGFLASDSDPESDERNLNYEPTMPKWRHSDDDILGTSNQDRESFQHEDDVRETSDQNMRETSDQNMRESMKREELNLMNLDEVVAPRDVKDLPSSLFLSDSELMSNSLLANIPPPTANTVISEILNTAVPPPPPDMFGGTPSEVSLPTLPPYIPPTPYSASMLPSSQQPRMMQSKKQEPIVTSPQNPLDDLTSVVQKEFQSAQSPKKSVVPQSSVSSSKRELDEDQKVDVKVDSPLSSESIVDTASSGQVVNSPQGLRRDIERIPSEDTEERVRETMKTGESVSSQSNLQRSANDKNHEEGLSVATETAEVEKIDSSSGLEKTTRDHQAQKEDAPLTELSQATANLKIQDDENTAGLSESTQNHENPEEQISEVGLAECDEILSDEKTKDTDSISEDTDSISEDISLETSENAPENL